MFRAPQQFRKRQILPHQGWGGNVGCSHPAKGRWWFGVSAVGGEEPGEQKAGGRGMRGEVGVTVAAAERGHQPFVSGAAADCLGAPGKGAGRPWSLWKPQLTMWAGEHGQESITTAVSPRRKGPPPHGLLCPVTGSWCPPDCARDENALRAQADIPQMRWSSAPDHVLALLSEV